MIDLLGSIWWMIVSLGVLVTFHEFGHFWVARRCGVKVLRFSVGFGRPLWSRRDRHGTEFAIAAIPLGGYVKMLDQREGEVAADELAMAFNRKSVWQRIAVAIAGPVANIVLCLLLLWAMFVIGKQDYSPTLGTVQGLAAQAGLRPGDRVLAVDQQPVTTWADVSMRLITAALDKRDLRLRALGADGGERTLTVAVSQLPPGFQEQRVPNLVGFGWQHLITPARISRVAPNTPAAGLLRVGDRIIAIDGHTIDSADQVAPHIQSLGQHGGLAMIEVERDGERLALELRPARISNEQGKPAYQLGIGLGTDKPPAYDVRLQYGPLAAVPAAIRETGRIAGESLGMMRRMLTGQASVKNVSGPITIAKVANASAKRGLDWFLYFLALLSLSLAIINLLPIPVLDGGHLLYYLIELVKGSPLSERAMAAGQYLGLAILAALMGLAFYNDLLGRIP